MSDRRNICITVSYNGAGFSGWQRLSGGQRSVQESLELLLGGILGEEIKMVGAGRTDAGVHAEGQVANFWTHTDLALPDLAALVKPAMPADIRCLALREALPNFHARYRALSKTYAYRLHDGPRADPHPGKKAYHVAARLDEVAMRSAGGLFTGIRNFYAFTNAKSDARNFLRELTEVRIERQGPLVDVFFTADGFLNRQVRIMASLMADIGLQRRPPEQVRHLLESPDRTQAPDPLAAYGLRLIEVRYRDSDFLGPELRLD